MLLDPEGVAEELITFPGSPIPPEMLHQLAWAISNKEGVVTRGKQVCLVLRNPLEAVSPDTEPFIPTIVMAEMPKSTRGRSTLAIAQHFATCTKPGKLARQHPGFSPRTNAHLRVELSGNSLESAATAVIEQRGVNGQEPRKVTWYNLFDVPKGGFVYVVKEDGGIVLAQKFGDDHWALLNADGNSDVVDIPQAINNAATTAGLTGQVKGFKPVDGSTAFIVSPLPD